MLHISLALVIFHVFLSQALKHLNSLQVINFGDCLVRPSGAVAIAESISEGLPILKVTLKENSINKMAILFILDHFAMCNFLLFCFFVVFFCQELNLSFGEITEEAALAVAHAIKGKSQLEKLELNGTLTSQVYFIVTDIPSAADCFAFYKSWWTKKSFWFVFVR